MTPAEQLIALREQLIARFAWRGHSVGRPVEYETMRTLWDERAHELAHEKVGVSKVATDMWPSFEGEDVPKMLYAEAVIEMVFDRIIAEMRATDWDDKGDPMSIGPIDVEGR